MTYTMKQSDWQWQIEPEPQSKLFRLKYKRPTEWILANLYDSPEAAADAVASGRTGEKEWDDMKRESPLPGLASWLIDPSGPISVVTTILKAAMANSEAANGQNG